jgi:hypothetical protein
MAGYFIVDVKTRKIIAICTVVALVLFAIGIVIGYFSGRGNSSSTVTTSTGTVAEAIKSECSEATIKSAAGKLFIDRYVEKHSEKNICLKSASECWDFGLPRNYVAYHLNEKSITIDGKLDDEAWKEVSDV